MCNMIYIALYIFIYITIVVCTCACQMFKYLSFPYNCIFAFFLLLNVWVL